MSKIPDSTQQVHGVVLVMLIGGLATISRYLYGKDDLHWRRMTGRVMVSMFLSMFVYSIAAIQFEVVSGYLGCAIGVAVGLFTDDVLLRAGEVVRNRIGKSGGQ